MVSIKTSLFIYCPSKSGPLISDVVWSCCQDSPVCHCAPAALWLFERGGHSSPSAYGFSVVHVFSLTPGYLKHIQTVISMCNNCAGISCSSFVGWRTISLQSLRNDHHKRHTITYGTLASCDSFLPYLCSPTTVCTFSKRPIINYSLNHDIHVRYKWM